MSDGSTTVSYDRIPTVSIILPTYNRERFLRQAFASINAQTFRDWELIVVDDGSTDGTEGLIERLHGELAMPVRYLWQSNQGAYAARNRGMDLARGRFFAFFDSDDRWLPHHLADCVRALEANPKVDWVYGAGRQVDELTGAIIWSHSFYEGDRPRPFLGLKTSRSGPLRIIEDPSAVRCMILNGLYCGLQNSVLRCRVFERLALPAYRVGEDQAFAILALKEGYHLGYLDNIHVIKMNHPGGVSAACAGAEIDHRVWAIQTFIACMKDLSNRVNFSICERIALRKRISREMFWTMGYALLSRHGKIEEARAAYRRAIEVWPFDPWYWKTYYLSRGVLSRFRTSEGGRIKPEQR